MTEEGKTCRMNSDAVPAECFTRKDLTTQHRTSSELNNGFHVAIALSRREMRRT